jgi:hypothetical protein
MVVVFLLYGLLSRRQPVVEKTFEEKYGTGLLPCEGFACNPQKPCSVWERWLCKDVVSEIAPIGSFWGQYWVSLPSGPRRLDFAIKTPEGKCIAVELDGFSTHTKDLERKDFDDQLSRQNELVCAGWTVLRFSTDQLRKNPKQCCEILQSAMINNSGNLIIRDPVLKAHCPNPGCEGKVFLNRSTEDKLYWRCSSKTCKKTFNRDAIAPEELVWKAQGNSVKRI